ncbi:MAG TPA: methylated-DNA--[protein]-cysteine S-methyltransferase [Rudaea sp.]|jgi:AraC family transcriptional regulator of adaptative response/methylated-DNA-[protein]-cysteine methyltransferase
MTAMPRNTDLQIDPLARALALIADAGDTPPSLSELAREVGLSASYLQRSFRKRFGVSPAEYARSLKLENLKSALRAAPRVTDAIYDAGYGSGSRVYEKTGQLLGMTPATYRRGAAGVALRYTTLQTPLGRLLVAATERGICRVALGDDDENLVTDLRREFPKATLERVDAGRDEWLAAVVARVQSEIDDDSNPTTALPPLDIRATAFQWRVWQALQRIPRGSTRSYSDVAAEIGAPRSVRAVANACGRNRLAVVVPCHRVIREDGSLGGYRWGIARKRDLIEREARRKG